VVVGLVWGFGLGRVVWEKGFIRDREGWDECVLLEQSRSDAE
jgi:hypothetical protein